MGGKNPQGENFQKDEKATKEVLLEFLLGVWGGICLDFKKTPDTFFLIFSIDRFRLGGGKVGNLFSKKFFAKFFPRGWGTTRGGRKDFKWGRGGRVLILI